MPQGPGTGNVGGSPTPQLQPLFGRAELVLVARADAQVHITRTGATAAAGIEAGVLDVVAAEQALFISPLFGGDAERLRAQDPFTGEAATRRLRSRARTRAWALPSLCGDVA